MKLLKKYKPELVCSKDELRPVLHECFLDEYEGKSVIVSTDGRIMVFLPCEVQEGERGTLPTKALKFARKESLKHEEHIQLAVSHGKIEFLNGWSMPHGEQLKFPEWKQVIPEKPVTFSVSLNAAMLHTIAKAMGSDQVRLDFSDPMHPIRVSDPSGEARGVLMPMRDGREQ
jgi:DNA polymerase III sliding clamp (beta) subunit (PCNA family)